MKVSTVTPPDRIQPKRALISVSDKAGMVEFARALHGAGVEILTTGGSKAELEAAGVPVVEVASVTGFPEIMDGRVKTLHPKIHGGLLAVRGEPSHAEAMATHGIEGIDILCVNLYPFEATVARGAPAEETVENIDIGGPAMIRAAAKNHGYVTVVVEPSDYGAVIEAIAAGGPTVDLRRRLAAKAFSRTAAYDAAVSGWFARELSAEPGDFFAVGGRLAEELRYGENPHQSARFYRTGEPRFGVATARQVQGKALSYNNINDTDAAFELVSEFGADRPAVAIIKHANPCGVGTGASLLEAYEKALACDPVSAFGGIVALNGRLDAEAAAKIVEVFTEVIIAPEASDEAAAIIAGKKNLRLLVTGGLADPATPGLAVRSVAGGLLVQSRDFGRIGADDLRVVTKRAPTAAEIADLLFAFRVAKHVKSNAIVYAKGGATVGIGAGQMSRVDSSRIAARKAEDAAAAAGLSGRLTDGAVVASDAFFPFADGLQAAVEAGATAVIQPGGSMRDDEVIAAADAAGLAMVFTGMRHFRH
ncbi:bifunctional phosphoribosylaminoimidazolecarboxamide formyltransferase/IMP cyclohydrolase [Methylobrevis pamukkalensis]|uniref:Bifunctional purine biosynthesis protein PurH n=1 Tax=Methylobrevis pamukkalensis TaxID=1439726 RepID=A0A1E3H6W6_9HYPH|nr:bifunctional phosphoribosylaminoimidazolecarboxamide formyltransferase/IMP cyclohydrolase [Methylobrevis pamukkalensis]ODN72079.1 Bifunctional purine biosynthesis protein PurH [Methylobrevis pamukkalensis]